MAIVKCKPTSPGRRHVVKIVNQELYKGKPFAALLDSKSKSGGRNNNGRITTRHNTILTVPQTSPWCCMQTVSVVTSWLRKA